VKVPYIKAHGARNDFLLTWRHQISGEIGDPVGFARAICERHAGVGADGWILMTQGSGDADAAIELWNSDGSRSEISGNGTRCAAALVVSEGRTRGSTHEKVTIATGAGPKTLRVLRSDGHSFFFEMNMGRATIEELHAELISGFECVILNVGNPQCAVFTADFEFDWRALGAHLERHPRFPKRTNVSFIRLMDDHNIDVRFFERGAGETMSSGTGSTGAAAAAMARGWVKSPVEVATPAGVLEVRMENDEFLLSGPAEIVAAGEFLYESGERE